jgi:hypothetical protein
MAPYVWMMSNQMKSHVGRCLFSFSDFASLINYKLATKYLDMKKQFSYERMNAQYFATSLYISLTHSLFAESIYYYS